MVHLISSEALGEELKNLFLDEHLSKQSEDMSHVASLDSRSAIILR